MIIWTLNTDTDDEANVHAVALGVALVVQCVFNIFLKIYIGQNIATNIAKQPRHAFSHEANSV